ncbi:MAG: tetratricopeptide repeat protein [Phycisphaerae bacterium]|nr:tetratricopeptide repeat protein [Phycisphaerae bacterium]
MPHNGEHHHAAKTPAGSAAELVAAVRRFFEQRHRLRQAVILLNNGRHGEAAECFAALSRACPDRPSLSACLAASLHGAGRHAEAVEASADALPARQDDDETCVRYAWALWNAGRRDAALSTLRERLLQRPDRAELHYQMATLLASADSPDEAELHFRRAVVLDENHVDALVGLALCEGVRRRTSNALRHLTRAQRLRPSDARTNLLLSLAAQAAEQMGLADPVQAALPDVGPSEAEAVEQLSRVIEAEPDFVDAFLSLPPDDLDADVFGLLAETLSLTLRRQPEHADLYYHCGRVLERLGRRREAIEATEQAVRADPGCVRALIQLGTLYGQTNRLDDAAGRLEEAIARGAAYPDVYLLLGHQYRRSGRTDRARWAYGQALHLNSQFAAAREALASLANVEVAAVQA